MERSYISPRISIQNESLHLINRILLWLYCPLMGWQFALRYNYRTVLLLLFSPTLGESKDLTKISSSRYWLTSSAYHDHYIYPVTPLWLFRSGLKSCISFYASRGSWKNRLLYISTFLASLHILDSSIWWLKTCLVLPGLHDIHPDIFSLIKLEALQPFSYEQRGW